MGVDVEEGKPMPVPPVDWRATNALKRLFFAHVGPLIAEGTVRRLEPTDLCHLDALDSQRVRAIRLIDRSRDASDARAMVVVTVVKKTFFRRRRVSR